MHAPVPLPPVTRTACPYCGVGCGVSARPDGIEAVSIVTPNHMHFPVAKLALEKGFHVICDKPLTTTFAEAQDLLAMVRGTGRRYFSNRAHGALGYALAASVGAHYGRPSVKAVAVMGDGSFGMCAGELETVVRLKLPITFVVISNATYGWIKAGQKAGYAQRYFAVDFGVTDHAKVAAAFGVRSWRVTDPSELSPVLKNALSSAEPALVDIVCQPLHEAQAPVSEWVA